MTEATSSAPADATQQTQTTQQTSTEATQTAQTTATETTQTTEQAQEKKQPWFQARIDHLTREKYEAKRAQEQAEAEAKTLREQLARAAQMPPQTAPQQTTTTPTNYQPATFQAPQTFTQADVERLAEQKVRQERFNEQCNNTYQAGKKEFGAEFDSILANFKLLGGLDQHPALLEAATAIPEGHRVLQHLGSNLDEAHRVLSLPPVQMAVEIARLSGTLKGRAVSQAPPPVKGPNTGSPVGDSVPDDNGDFQGSSEEEKQAKFRAWREKNRKRR